MGDYLDTITARKQITAFGSEHAKALSDDDLNAIITEIESLIDQWVGYRAIETEYDIKKDCNSKGVATIPHRRVKMIVSVAYQLQHDATNQTYPLKEHEIFSIWDGTQSIVAPWLSFALLHIKYIAGFSCEELPPEFKRAAIALLRLADEKGGIIEGMLDPLIFDEIYREPASISLPSGLKKGFHKSDSSPANPVAGGSPTQTILDYTLAKYLQKYRRAYAFA